MENEELVEEVANQAEVLVQLSHNIHASYNKIRYMNKRIQEYEKKLKKRSGTYRNMFYTLIMCIIEMTIVMIIVIYHFKRVGLWVIMN